MAAAHEYRLGLPDDENNDEDDNNVLNILAGRVARRMELLEMTSMTWESGSGGPPPKERSRPWRAFLNWLLEKLGDVVSFLWRAVDTFGRVIGPFLRRTSVEVELHVSVNVGLPPSIGVSADPYLLMNAEIWTIVSKFVEGIRDGYGSKAIGA